MSSNLFIANGVNAATGTYGMAPVPMEDLKRAIYQEANPGNLNELIHKVSRAQEAHKGVIEGVDPKELREAGWGLICAEDEDAAVVEALTPLLNLRREQAGERFRIYKGADGYHDGESKNRFLARHGIGPGPADPDIVPYYLLIVGSPDKISYFFQYVLSVDYAVGRIHFDRLEDYDIYARSVVQAETGSPARGRRIGMFGVSNPRDLPTSLCTDMLIEPLANELASAHGTDWHIERALRQDATKARLAELLGGTGTPALLVTGSHGVEFPVDDPRHVRHQGALLCQDWPGPHTGPVAQPISEAHFFSRDDLAGDADLRGLVAYFFCCYGAGTMPTQVGPGADPGAATQKYAFVAGLPAAMLSHPRGGALAVIGHSERTWSYSFQWPGAPSRASIHTSVLERLLRGYPVGAAVEYFRMHYAGLASELVMMRDNMALGMDVSADDLAQLWTAHNDARSCVVVGDPAMRLQC